MATTMLWYRYHSRNSIICFTWPQPCY